MNARASINNNNAEADTRKFAFVARQFTFKSAECIISNRVPEDFPDLDVDDNAWFSLNIQKSNQIRQVLSQTLMHGYATVDIKLTNQDEILERWYLIHLPLKHTDTVPISQKGRKEVKIFTYRRYSAVLRSLFSLLGALPTATLRRYLSQTPLTRRSLHAEISHFQPLPVKPREDMQDFEVAKLRFGPVITPVGKSIIILHHRVDIEPLIPRPIRTGPLLLPKSSFTKIPVPAPPQAGDFPAQIPNQSPFTISQFSPEFLTQIGTYQQNDGSLSARGSYLSFTPGTTGIGWLSPSSQDYNGLPEPMTHTEMPTFLSQLPPQPLDDFVEELEAMEGIELAQPPEPEMIQTDFQAVKESFLAFAGPGSPPKVTVE